MTVSKIKTFQFVLIKQTNLISSEFASSYDLIYDDIDHKKTLFCLKPGNDESISTCKRMFASFRNRLLVNCK